jgi:hypothetical protein
VFIGNERGGFSLMRIGRQTAKLRPHLNGRFSKLTLWLSLWLLFTGVFRKRVRPEWRLVKAQQNKLFFKGFSGSRSVSAGEAVKWLKNQVFSLVKVRHTAKQDGT